MHVSRMVMNMRAIPMNGMKQTAVDCVKMRKIEAHSPPNMAPRHWPVTRLP